VPFTRAEDDVDILAQVAPDAHRGRGLERRLAEGVYVLAFLSPQAADLFAIRRTSTSAAVTSGSARVLGNTQGCERCRGGRKGFQCDRITGLMFACVSFGTPCRDATKSSTIAMWTM